MAEHITIPGIGDIIAEKYLIKKELGRGAYGVVFGCEQLDIGRYLAVKTLLPQAFLQGEVVKRFHREAQLISRLDHPNVIRLFDYGVHESLLYMAVEFVSGETLGELIQRDAPLEPAAVKRIAIQILEGLDHAHSNGIVHRDLKPENVIVIQKEEGFEAKILDFGVSKLIRGDDNDRSAMNTLTQDGTVLGTPHYMSPENIVGDIVDHRADLYALGVIMYEMLTGEHPFDAPSPSAVFIRHVRDDAAPFNDTLQNSVLGATVFHALEKQPDDRVQSAREMCEMLLSETYSTPPSAIVAETEDETSPRKVILAGVLAGALIAIFGIFVLLFAFDKEKNATDIASGKTPITNPQHNNKTHLKLENIKEEPPLDENENSENGYDFSGDLTELDNAILVSKTLTSQAIQRALLARTSTSKMVRKHKDKKNIKTIKEKKEDKITSIRVSFKSVPNNSVVRVNGTRIGTTPVSRSFDDPSKTIRVSFSQLGYQNASLSFKPEARKSVMIKLKPKRLGID